MFEEMASSTGELLLIAFFTIIFICVHAIELKHFWELAKGKDPENQ